DFATANFSLSRQTDGFGSLTSRLGQRRTSDELAYNFNSTIYFDSLIPERYNWNIPVSFSAHRSITTPRYFPTQGDVTLEEFKKAVHARGDITNEQKERLIERQKNASQTYIEDYSLNLVNITKNGSQSFFGRYLLDNTTLNFVYNNI